MDSWINKKGCVLQRNSCRSRDNCKVYFKAHYTIRPMEERLSVYNEKDKWWRKDMTTRQKKKWPKCLCRERTSEIQGDLLCLTCWLWCWGTSTRSPPLIKAYEARLVHVLLQWGLCLARCRFRALCYKHDNADFVSEVAARDCSIIEQRQVMSDWVMLRVRNISVELTLVMYQSVWNECMSYTSFTFWLVNTEINRLVHDIVLIWWSPVCVLVKILSLFLCKLGFIMFCVKANIYFCLNW